MHETDVCSAQVLMHGFLQLYCPIQDMAGLVMGISAEVVIPGFILLPAGKASLSSSNVAVESIG